MDWGMLIPPTRGRWSSRCYAKLDMRGESDWSKNRGRLLSWLAMMQMLLWLMGGLINIIRSITLIRNLRVMSRIFRLRIIRTRERWKWILRIPQNPGIRMRQSNLTCKWRRMIVCRWMLNRIGLPRLTNLPRLWTILLWMVILLCLAGEKTWIWKILILPTLSMSVLRVAAEKRRPRIWARNSVIYQPQRNFITLRHLNRSG